MAHDSEAQPQQQADPQVLDRITVIEKSLNGMYHLFNDKEEVIEDLRFVLKQLREAESTVRELSREAEEWQREVELLTQTNMGLREQLAEAERIKQRYHDSGLLAVQRQREAEEREERLRARLADADLSTGVLRRMVEEEYPILPLSEIVDTWGNNVTPEESAAIRSYEERSPRAEK
jgi:hypothetical protein